jgi:hypothetical protein
MGLEIKSETSESQLAESGPKAHKLPKAIEDNEILESLTSFSVDS